jgi:WhiB family redox-sensing transcriptional regulator
MKVITMTTIEDISEQAACRDKGPEMFFVDEGPISNKSVRLAIAKAVAVCNNCPVQAQCLVNAVNNKEEFGIWGGITTKERKYLMKQKTPMTIGEAKEFIQWKRTTV